MKIVIVEGVDGSGKTTLIKALEKFFNQRRVYVFNYSYPKHSWEMFQEAAEARGEYYASIRIFKQILEKDPSALIICDRFHLGEYAYGPVKRGYPEFLAEEILKVEGELLKEFGRKDIRLILMGVSKPEVALERSKWEGEYLTDLKEYEAVNSRYALTVHKTFLPVVVFQPDYLNKEEVFERVVEFIMEDLKG